jgi:two-component system phosphorelay protein LuxU
MSNPAHPLALDARALNALTDAVGADNVVMIIDTILGSVPAMSGQLRAAAVSGNLRGLMHVAHQLKSDCAYVGATDLCARLQQIESGAEEGRLAQPVAEADLVSSMIEGFLSALRGVRNARAQAA